MNAFVADEDVDAPIIASQRWSRCRFDRGALTGIVDDEVLRLATDQQRILITADHDFGELVFRLGRVTTGVVLIRLHGLTADRKAEIVSTMIAAHASELPGNFTVIAPDAVRIRKA